MLALLRIYFTLFFALISWRNSGRFAARYYAICRHAVLSIVSRDIRMKFAVWYEWEVPITWHIPFMLASRPLKGASWYTYVRRTNKMHTFCFSIIDFIHVHCLRYVSNNQLFIIRKTTSSFMVFCHAEHIIKLCELCRYKILSSYIVSKSIKCFELWFYYFIQCYIKIFWLYYHNQVII